MSFYTTSVCFCSCCFDQHVRSIKIILQVGNKQWDQSLFQELKYLLWILSESLCQMANCRPNCMQTESMITSMCLSVYKLHVLHIIMQMCHTFPYCLSYAASSAHSCLCLAAFLFACSNSFASSVACFIFFC